MNAIDWLEQNAPGFREFSDNERDVIIEFLLLWSLFEAKVLDQRGSANAILDTAKQWAGKGLLSQESFELEINYFRNRYYAGGEYTHHFEHLHLRENDFPDLVKKVLRNMDANPDEVAAATLIIVYRFRNNLFHGVKWSYKLRGQLKNFNHANIALMKAVELYNKADQGVLV